MDSLDMLQTAGTSAITGIITGTMTATEAIRSFANSVLNEAVGALMEMGVQYVKNKLIAKLLLRQRSPQARPRGCACFCICSCCYIGIYCHNALLLQLVELPSRLRLLLTKPWR